MKSKLVGFLGAPGSGKTTLACAMKESSLQKNIGSDICTEYAREFSYKYGISSNPYAQYRITFEQKVREDLLLQGKNEFVFSDSPIWLGYIFSLVNIKSDSERETRDIIGDLYQKFVIDYMYRYHRVFYITNPSPKDDGCRNMEVNKKIANIIEGFVSSHEHVLPITRLEIPTLEIEKRKEFIWNRLQY